jgi:hypothetical protein
MLSAAIDPLGDADRVERVLDRARDAGITHLAVGLAAESPDHYVEQLDVLAARIGTGGPEGGAR